MNDPHKTNPRASAPLPRFSALNFLRQTAEISAICLLVFLATFIGCSTTSNTLRIRAVAPTVDEAFRKLSLAINVDGYEVERIDASAFTIETKWRDAKEQEKLASDKLATQQVKLVIQFARRGQAYDVFLTPSIQVGTIIAEPQAGHPLIEKWKRIINSIVQKENREED